MLPTLNLGPFVLPTGGVIAILGVWLALTAVERSAARLKLDVEAVYSVAATALLAGVVAARAFFVFLYWPAFAANPLSIVWPLNSGYTPAAGMIVGVLVVAALIQARRLRVRAVLDALAPAVLVALITLHLADFAAGPGYGDETAVFWGLVQFGVRRHPVQLYQIAILLLALLAWWRATVQTRRADLPSGTATLWATAVAAAGTVVTTPWHANPWLLPGGWHGAQLVALAVLMASLILLARLSSNTTAANPHLEQPGPETS